MTSESTCARLALFAGVAISAVSLGAGPAFAQAQTSAPAVESASPAPTTTQLGEIVVTAQRRSERLQDVPIAVSAVTPEAARQFGFQNMRDVQLTMPSTDLGAGDGFLQLYIRGLGQPFATPGLESPVSVYLDGMYVPRTGGTNALLDLVDPATVQVLRGPQGTLYGRNATGGVVLLNSALPTDHFEGSLLGEYGRFDHKQVEGMLNTPLTDTLSFRLAGRFTDEDGYVKNIATGTKVPEVHRYVVRATLRWRPTEATDLIWGTEYQRSGPVFASIDQLGAGAPTCWLCTRTGAQPAPDFYQQDSNQTRPWEASLFRTYLKGSVQVGSLQVTSLTSYFRDIVRQEADTDFTTSPAFFFRNNQGGTTFAEDLQVASNYSGPFNFLAGVTYLHDKPYIDISLLGDDYQFAADATGAFPEAANHVVTKSTAVFLEGSYEITDELKLTLGGRYTHDSRSIDAKNSAGFQLFGLPAGFSDSKSFDAFTPRVVLAWNNKITNLYYSFTKGFKAGGFASPATSPTQSVGPEKIASHEIGAKNTAFNGRLQTTAAIFYYKDTGLQTQIIDSTGGGTITRNAGSVVGYGAEFQVTARVLDDLTVGGSASYLEAYYSSYKDASIVCFDPTGTLNPAAPGATLYACSANLTGNRVPHAPRYTLSGNASYDFQLGNWSGNLAAVAQYRSSIDLNPGAGGQLAFDKQKAYVLANMSAYVSPPDSKIRLGAYVNNVFNARYATFRSTQQPYGLFYNAGIPRTYGVRVEYKF